MARGKRVCVVCGKDQHGKRVWEKYGGERTNRVICYDCGPEWSFWRDGSLYNSKTGPTEKQRADLARRRAKADGR